MPALAMFFATLSLFILLYVYLGYPVLVMLLRKPVVTVGLPSVFPSVSIVISARDSGEEVKERIKNCFTLDYPAAVEILVAGDDSPGAYQAALEFASQGVRAYNFPRIGKASVQNRLIREASGDVIVTTDVQARFAPDFLRLMTAPFADPSVGGASGIMKIVNRAVSGTADTEANYWSYEQRLRALESDAGMLLSVVGACFAFRKACYRDIGEASDTDNLVPMQLAEQGFKTVLVEEAVVLEEAIESHGRELRNRTRSVTRSFADYVRHPRLLNPFAHPRYALCIWSHKLLRWLTPYFVIAFWISTYFLRGALLPRIVFVSGAVALLASVIGWISEKFWRLPLLWAALVSVLVVNIAFINGTFNALRRKRIVVW